MTRRSGQPRSASSPPYPPVFATNRPAQTDGRDDEPPTPDTVADEVNWLLRGARTLYAEQPAVAIATAYINPGGFGLIADELEHAPSVRLLLGAEPEPGTELPKTQKLVEQHYQRAMRGHEEWLAHERDLTGFTRDADTAARRLLDWLRSLNESGGPRVEVRRYARGFMHGKAFVTDHPNMPAVLAGSSNFTLAGLSRNVELNLGYPTGELTHLVQEWFDELWEDAEAYDLAALYAPRWDPHDPWTIFVRMLFEAYGADLEGEQETSVGHEMKLTRFQREGVARMLRILERHNGVIVADEVGLGKTYMAGEVIRRATDRKRQQVLVVSPAAIKKTMWDPFLKRHDFSRRVEALSYDELRIRWDKGGAERDRLDDYALVVVDEAHNLRNPQAQRTEAVSWLAGGENPKQLVLLTATPVNNTLYDLHSLVSLFVRNDAALADRGIRSIRGYIRRAEQMNPEDLSHEHLFDLMDEVTVRRTRHFVKRHYAGDTIDGPDGPVEIVFPTPTLRRIDYELDAGRTALLEEVVYALDTENEPGDLTPSDARSQDPRQLLLSRYTPDTYRTGSDGQIGRQVANAGLLRSTVLKRLESSTVALRSTLGKLIESHETFLTGLASGYVLSGEELRRLAGSDEEDFDSLLDSLDETPNDVRGYEADRLEADVRRDLALLRSLAEQARRVSGEPKADRLVERLTEVAKEARGVSETGLSSGDRRKVIVFSSFVPTIRDLHERVLRAIDASEPESPLRDFEGRVAEPVYGSKAGVDQTQRAEVIGSFAPKTVRGGHEDLFDLLLTTDVLAEGVNLQQAGRIINYDLPWNPMRIVQRHGRIDRIGSPHRRVFLDCFFPTKVLDNLLELAQRLRDKLRLADAAVGPGNVLPGIEGKPGHVFTDEVDEQIQRIWKEDASLLDTHRANVSGEELRRRLRDALGETAHDTSAARDVQRLPHGVGSGFVQMGLPRNGYVFCVRVMPASGDAGAYPCRFRFVQVDDAWRCEAGEDANARSVGDTLTALMAADPKGPGTERVMSGRAYNGAFDAWQVARRDVYEEWMLHTDPQSLQPSVPKALRDAAALVLDHGQFLGYEEQEDLRARLNTAPSERIVRAFRHVLRDEAASDRAKVERIQSLTRELGLELPTIPDPLPEIEIDDVRLIAWMAVKAGAPDPSD